MLGLRLTRRVGGGRCSVDLPPWLLVALRGACDGVEMTNDDGSSSLPSPLAEAAAPPFECSGVGAGELGAMSCEVDAAAREPSGDACGGAPRLLLDEGANAGLGGSELRRPACSVATCAGDTPGGVGAACCGGGGAAYLGGAGMSLRDEVPRREVLGESTSGTEFDGMADSLTPRGPRAPGTNDGDDDSEELAAGVGLGALADDDSPLSQASIYIRQQQ